MSGESLTPPALLADEALRGSPETYPDELLSQVGIAALLGVSRQRINQLLQAGRLPAPAAVVDGDRLVWRADQFEDDPRLGERPRTVR